MNNIDQIAKQYLNENRQMFFEQYASDIKPADEKLVFFTAGMSGVGKTEFAIYLKENISNLLHIDTDEIRKFFEPIGYDGQNSADFQRASSRGFNELFNHALKNNIQLVISETSSIFKKKVCYNVKLF